MTAATVVRSILSSPGTAILADDRMKIGRVIRAAHERTGSHVLEAFRTGDLTVGIETLRRDELDHRKMLRRRPEILAQREDLTTDLTQIVHGLEKFRLLFAQAEHHSALGHDLRGK